MAEHSGTVDDYIASFPADVQVMLREVRRAIHEAVPGAEDGIRYNMPVVRVDGSYVVHYAGWKKHIGLYPVPALDEPLEHEVAPYRAAKDTLRFPLRDPLPYDLIRKLAGALAAMR
jgi:uncharacterized protein YdhG (YjbR/CyaY superfamily)